MQTTKNVLVCEDDPVQLKILTTLINQAGYRSLAARTPSEAVVAARRCGIDAVLTDVQLQDGNAFDLLGDLRRFGFDAPVFMASAYATEGMKDRARAAGARFFFEKPFDLPKIRERVDEALRAVRSLDATVLIVENHRQVREDLESLAVDAGFSALTAEDGARALEILLEAKSKVDLCLLDLHAHGSSGAKLIRKALEIDPGLHVVMMSGDASREEIRAGYAAGAVSLIRKPASPERLRSFLAASLKAARADRQRAAMIDEHRVRRASEPASLRLLRWLRSCVQAPARSRKGGQVASVTCAAAAALIGAGVAFGLQGAYETADHFEWMADRAAGFGALPPGSSIARQDSFLARLQATEQLRLMRESNEITRRYYESHLQELRWQHRSKADAESPAQIPSNLRDLRP